MIRNWVKNLCTYIDNLDESCSTVSQEPIIGQADIHVYIYRDNPYEAKLRIGQPLYSFIDINKAESTLLNESIDNFKERVNEKRVIEFLKPFVHDPEDI